MGILDSGLGGLTAVRALRKMLPGENIVFLGDTKHLPYGEKSPEAITEYSTECLRFLESRDVKYIIVACGTISSVLGDRIATDFKVPATGILGPAVRAAAERTRTGKVALIATEATIESGAYEKTMARDYPEITVFPKACPLFVPMVENGYFGEDSEPARMIAEDYLSVFSGKDIDTMILGCTHYPLLTDLINDITGGKYSLVNAGYETAEYVSGYLRDNGLLGNETGGTAEFYVTDMNGDFSAHAEKFLGEPLGEARLVEVQKG